MIKSNRPGGTSPAPTWLLIGGVALACLGGAALALCGKPAAYAANKRRRGRKSGYRHNHRLVYDDASRLEADLSRRDRMGSALAEAKLVNDVARRVAAQSGHAHDRAVAAKTQQLYDGLLKVQDDVAELGGTLRAHELEMRDH